MSPGEFAQTVFRSVKHDGASLVIIDTINGHMKSVLAAKLLTIDSHELLAALCQLGVTTIMVNAPHGIVGLEISSLIDASCLADTVIAFCYVEADGEVCRAISVIKKRTGRHERAIGELRIDRGGIQLGEPLRGYEGMLTGVPVRDDVTVPEGDNGPA